MKIGSLVLAVVLAGAGALVATSAQAAADVGNAALWR